MWDDSDERTGDVRSIINVANWCTQTEWKHFGMHRMRAHLLYGDVNPRPTSEPSAGENSESERNSNYGAPYNGRAKPRYANNAHRDYLAANR